MGLFGDLDANEVSDNPFYVAPDTYLAVLTEVKKVEKNEGGEGLSFKWSIQDEDSEFYQQNVQDWKNIYPDVPSDELTANQKKDNARLKKLLQELGLTPDEMNVLLDDDNLDRLVGIEANIEVVETRDKNDDSKVYTNIRKVSLFEE